MPRTFTSMEEAKSAPVIWSEGTICHALALYFEWWRNIIVPNIYIGGSFREIDLSILTPAGLLWAIEIKVSLADWKRDLGKGKYPSYCSPARFYYAVPDTIVKWSDDEGTRTYKRKPILPDWVPAHAGVIFIRNRRDISSYEGKWVILDTPERWYVKQCRPLHRTPLQPKYREEMMRKMAGKYWRHVTGVDMPEEVRVPACP
jgi:hypothetical protein